MALVEVCVTFEGNHNNILSYSWMCEEVNIICIAEIESARNFLNDELPNHEFDEQEYRLLRYDYVLHMLWTKYSREQGIVTNYVTDILDENNIFNVIENIIEYFVDLNIYMFDNLFDDDDEYIHPINNNISYMSNIFDLCSTNLINDCNICCFENVQVIEIPCSNNHKECYICKSCFQNLNSCPYCRKEL